jgi:hypothetical protein
VDLPPLTLIHYEATDCVVLISAGGRYALSLTRREMCQALALAQRRKEPTP